MSENLLPIKLHQENVELATNQLEKTKVFYQSKNRPIDSTFDMNEAITALHRLAEFALNSGGSGSYVIQCFLVGLYNGDFKFDLTDLRRLDQKNFEDCLKVLRLDHPPFLSCEVHKYFEEGSQIFGKFITNITRSNAV